MVDPIVTVRLPGDADAGGDPHLTRWRNNRVFVREWHPALRGVGAADGGEVGLLVGIVRADGRLHLERIEVALELVEQLKRQGDRRRHSRWNGKLLLDPQRAIVA